MVATVILAASLLFILVGAIGVLSFSIDAERPAERQPAATHRVRQNEAAIHLLTFAEPLVSAQRESAPPADELLASLEAHLREERKAAAAFARDPSAKTLWMN